MRYEHTEVAVLGLSAGMAIAYELARCGAQVTALDRTDGRASTLNNQKWKHSGLLYQQRDLAGKMWDAYVDMHPIERRHLLVKGADFLAHQEPTLVEREAMWDDWEIPFKRLAPKALSTNSAPEQRKYVGGFRTPDSVIDFPALLTDLRVHAERLGARIVTRATVKRLVRDGDAVTGVIYEQDGQEVLLRCDHCIVALGGWAPEVLRGIGVHVPVRRWKSHIITVEGELVERITVVLDSPIVTLVPYKGHTLIADTRRTPTEDGNDRIVVQEAVEALKADLAAFFPFLRGRTLNRLDVHT